MYRRKSLILERKSRKTVSSQKNEKPNKSLAIAGDLCYSIMVL
ncbi:hypothetical protein PNI0006_00257 [Streptococcus pneumoniae PNI0006]|nr:hypothetical protein PNI0006_00257 [Streptococcus pneumoniae PNI0006]